MAIIGIDLGTTNSLGAVYRNHRVELIPNRLGNFLTPSVVSVAEDGSILVGDVAKERLVTYPECTAASFKKDMGTEKKWRLGGREFLAEELSSFIIRSIVEDAKNYLQEEIEEVIISVPAYFHDKQRVATKRAGMLAGVNVKRIINEPSAAALASYFDTSQEELILVFDFGGGTLDVSIVDCFDTMMEMLSVSGDNRLGGDNFHEIMADSFLAEHHLIKSEISAKEYAVLLRQAQACKQKLSEEDSAKMSAVIGDKVYQSEYTDARLLEESASILQRIKKVLAHALTDGGLTIQSINTVVMVGGSSKMPMIQSYLKHLFHKTPMVTVNCDEMIARGLGLVCAVKSRNEEVKDYIMTDICPFTLGTDTYNESDPAHSYMTPIIERNTVLPCSRVKRFYTSSDNQTKIDIQILQGEHPYAEDNLSLGKMRVMVPKKKRGEEAVDIRFTYDLNGILMADMTVVSTGKTVSKVISQTMDDRELKRRMEELEKLKIHPKNMSENKLIMERLQTLYEEAPMSWRNQIGDYIRYFDNILEQQNPRAIRNYRSFLESVIDQVENYDPFESYVDFPEYQEEEESWLDDDFEDDEEDGGVKWTS